MIYKAKEIVKNSIARVNYIKPYIKKFKHLESGYIKLVIEGLKTATTVKAIKSCGKDSLVGDSLIKLLSTVDITLRDTRYFYSIDQKKTLRQSETILGNLTINYETFIGTSLEDLDAIFDNTASLTDEQKIYCSNAKKTIDAMHIYITRAVQAIKSSSIINKEKQAAYLNNIKTQKATSFEEAIQRILLLNQFTWQTGHRLVGLGRLDKILDKYYMEDISNGVLAKEEALHMIVDFYQLLHSDYWYKSDSLLGDTGQIVILGGLDKEGTFLCNDLTYLFLQAVTIVKIPDPKVLLRVSEKMPTEIMEKAVDCLKYNTGSPLFSNDDVVIPLLIDSGIDEEDAYEYVTSACWEPYIVGKSLDQNNLEVINYLEPFFDMLGNTDLTTVNSFETLVELYKKFLKDYLQKLVKKLDNILWAEAPLLSVFMPECNENKKDVSKGGAKYSNYGVTSVAMANLINSLFNIKELVFEKRIYSLYELNKTRDSNFTNDASLLTILKNMPEKYGHDDDEVAEQVNAITAVTNEVLQNHKNCFGGKVKAGLSSPSYIMKSKKFPASFDGRVKGTPFATHISCMDVGYTELVQFAGKLDYTGNRFNGNVLDFFVAPSFLEDNRDKFVSFMTKAIKVGYFQMQMNIIDSETLIAAKTNPEKHPKLIVRVWGFSSYFNDLPDSYKDVLIERAIQSERTH